MCVSERKVREVDIVVFALAADSASSTYERASAAERGNFARRIRAREEESGKGIKGEEESARFISIARPWSEGAGGERERGR